MTNVSNNEDKSYDYELSWKTGPVPLSYLEGEKRSFAVSELHGRIIRKLVEHKGLNNKIRALWYAIIDALIQFSLSGKDKKNPKYLDYMNYRAHVAQTQMASLALERAIKAAFNYKKDEVIEVTCEKKEKEWKEAYEKRKKEREEHKTETNAEKRLKKPSKRVELKQEIQKQLSSLQELETLQKEAKEKKAALVKDMIMRTQWNNDEWLQRELKKIENSQDAITDTASLLELCSRNELKTVFQNQEPANKVLAVSEGLAMAMEAEAYQKEKETVQENEDRKLKDNLNTQVAQIKVMVNRRNQALITANEWTELCEKILRIAANYPYQDLYQQLSKISSEKRYEEMCEAIDNFILKKEQAAKTEQEEIVEDQENLEEIKEPVVQPAQLEEEQNQVEEEQNQVENVISSQQTSLPEQPIKETPPLEIEDKIQKEQEPLIPKKKESEEEKKKTTGWWSWLTKLTESKAPDTASKLGINEILQKTKEETSKRVKTLSTEELNLESKKLEKEIENKANDLVKLSDDQALDNLNNEIKLLTANFAIMQEEISLRK